MKFLERGHSVELEHVAPREGAWIEIIRLIKSHSNVEVAPREGAWIEIICWRRLEQWAEVAPREGAWIEINKFMAWYTLSKSLPARERGLK